MRNEVISNLVASLVANEIQLPQYDPRDLEAAIRSIEVDIARKLFKVEQVRHAVKKLNDARRFELTRTLGKAWLDCQPFDAAIAKRYAQALIDLFELDPAEELLRRALEVAESDPADIHAQSEIAEYRGLLGRIEKQRFIKTGDKQHLVNAADFYLTQLQAKPENERRFFWHSINVIALVNREQREHLPNRTTGIPSASDVYSYMKKHYKENPEDPWVLATVSEAALALGKCDEAELWLYRFLFHERTQPFYIHSYDRQLREIWLGDPIRESGKCADRLARICARHVLRMQSQFTISGAAVPALKKALEQGSLGELEKNFLGESTFSVANIRKMLDACSSIGCVTNNTGARLGTGFLIDGKWLGLETKNSVFITNAHVLSRSVPNAILPENALVTFEIESELAKRPIFYNVDRVLFESSPGNLGCSSNETLDVTIVTLNTETCTTLHSKVLKSAENLPLIQEKSKAYVIGHPLGSGLQISLNDSLLLDIDDDKCLIHYRTPTDPGSSGSPVFNSDWEVIGLHHGGSRKTPRLHGSGDYEANEAISLLAIKRCAQLLR